MKVLIVTIKMAILHLQTNRGKPMIVVKYGCQKPLIQVKGIVGSD